ncbi:MAG: autotransporter strand-loop-strand O-heptosyltransferase [Schwartzia sp.]|nr:autotransporter strand-loop-strand O-heptosyltransferase [Schwartzia sp. (in: firmicutes)]
MDGNTTAENAQNAQNPQSAQNPQTPPQKKYVCFNPAPVSLETELPGVKLDFNYGARVLIPKGNYHVRFTDLDTSSILYDADVSEALVTSTKKYYIHFRVEIWKDGQLALTHDLDLKGKVVHIRFPVGTIGDIMAWFPYSEEFRKKHGCEVYCSMSRKLAELFAPAYPKIHFIAPETEPENCYATYYMGIFFPADDRFHQPTDFRVTGLQLNIPYILGLDVVERRPILTPSKTRPIKEPYVCIAAQATSQAKYWNNPRGWIETVDVLKALGYRVLCIDREKCHGYGRHWNTIPYGAEDFTGDRPLQERVDFLGHADFFVGLSSGLSWIAWGSGTPVVLISGFTLPYNEFHTPYRVINFHVCNGCWTDSSEEFVHADFGWCPRHENTEREFECTRFISSGQVCQTIARLMQDYKLNPKKGHRKRN